MWRNLMERFVSVFYLYLVITSSFAPTVVAQAQFSGSNEVVLSFAGACPDTADCQTIELADDDVENLWDALYGNDSPFVGDVVEGGTVLSTDGDAETTIITTDESGETAHDQEISTIEFDWRSHVLAGQSCNGQFSSGVHVTDDVRVGVCRDATQDKRAENCEGIYGTNSLVAEAFEEVGADDYIDDGSFNTIMTGDFWGNMLCASGQNCTYIIFSEFEKAFNYSTSLVDVVTLGAPVAKSLGKSKIFGGKRLLNKFKLVGDDAVAIPGLGSVVKKTYPGAFKKDMAAEVSERLAKNPGLLERGLTPGDLADTASILRREVAIQNELGTAIAKENPARYAQLKNDQESLRLIRESIYGTDAARIAASGGKTYSGAKVAGKEINDTATKTYLKGAYTDDVLTKFKTETGGRITKMPKSWWQTNYPNMTTQQSNATALASKYSKVTGYYGYMALVRPVGRNILRTGGASIGHPVEVFATYRVEESWTRFFMRLKGHSVYDDAYLKILFNRRDDPKNPFSVDGLGNGNLLSKYVEVVAQMPAALPGGVGGGITSWIEKQERIDHVGDGQLYLTTLPFGETEESAEGSSGEESLTLWSSDGKIAFTAPSMRLYALELMSEEDKAKGPLISAYAHHTDMDMRVNFGDTERSTSPGETPIDIQKAVEEKNGCQDSLFSKNLVEELTGEESKWNVSAASIATAFNNNALPVLAIGAAPAGGFVAGIAATLISQWFVNTYFIGDCVDTTGGYYVTGHLDTAGEQSTEDIIASNINELGTDLLHGGAGQPIDLPDVDTLTDIDANIASVVGAVSGSTPEVLEIQVNLDSGLDNGGITRRPVGSLGIDGLFSLWISPDSACNQFEMPTEEQVITLANNADGSRLDIEKGPGTANICVYPPGGLEPVCMLDSDEANGDKRLLVNLTAADIELGGYVVPEKVVRIPAESITNLKVDPFNETISAGDNLFNCLNNFTSCLSSAPSITNLDISPLTGDALQMMTTAGAVITFTDETLTVSGSSRFLGGKESKVQVNSNGEVVLRSGNVEQNLGSFQALTTDNAVFLRESGSSSDILFWLKVTAVTNQSSINNITTNVATEMCDSEEVFDGFNFDFKAEVKDPQAAAEVLKMNEAIDNIGTLKVFETGDDDTGKIYYFWTDDACQPHFSIFDKETGEKTEFDILGYEQIGDNEYRLTTDKGDQIIEFENRNGKEYMKLNEGPWELLTKLMGRNGSLIFDQATATWKAINGQLLPLADAFKQLGMAIAANADGTVSGSPGGNVMIYSPPAGDGGLFQLPWWPENPLMAVVLAISLLAGVLAVRVSEERKKK
ncbi:MAG: hypothetical protein GOV15_01230 [Candidatus Diapherotrites archaeon]|nr:hypothetical protein [Candidatus Diapherotrites archaeon]